MPNDADAQEDGCVRPGDSSDCNTQLDAALVALDCAPYVCNVDAGAVDTGIAGTGCFVGADDDAACTGGSTCQDPTCTDGSCTYPAIPGFCGCASNPMWTADTA